MVLCVKWQVPFLRRLRAVAWGKSFATSLSSLSPPSNSCLYLLADKFPLATLGTRGGGGRGTSTISSSDQKSPERCLAVRTADAEKAGSRILQEVDSCEDNDAGAGGRRIYRVCQTLKKSTGTRNEKAKLQQLMRYNWVLRAFLPSQFSPLFLSRTCERACSPP